MFAVALLIMAAMPLEPAAVDRVDLIEVNHLYDQQGRHVIDQVIFWDWSHDRFQIRAWRLVKQPGQLPQRDRAGNYVSHWRDMQTMRHVTASRKRETWTAYDPEVADREILPIEYRQELSNHERPTKR